jgi:predicted unusual protein kinase regulating ubiquinone biosynthesis (AarF/ABC1/UbiB family)
MNMAMQPTKLLGMSWLCRSCRLAQEYLRSGQVDPPQTVLRKLFERLGATYIKLGQFIASSPSLFPEGDIGA